MYSKAIKSNVHSVLLCPTCVLVNWVLGVQLALIIGLVPLAHGQDSHLAPPELMPGESLDVPGTAAAPCDREGAWDEA